VGSTAAVNSTAAAASTAAVLQVTVSAVTNFTGAAAAFMNPMPTTIALGGTAGGAADGITGSAQIIDGQSDAPLHLFGEIRTSTWMQRRAARAAAPKAGNHAEHTAAPKLAPRLRWRGWVVLEAEFREREVISAMAEIAEALSMSASWLSMTGCLRLVPIHWPPPAPRLFENPRDGEHPS
jgi:hypothetical protein